MTTATTNTSGSGHFGDAVPGFFAKIWLGLMEISEANPQLKKLEYLASLPDAELAAKGLKREDIARYVFANKAHL